ncbi:hypothetical protein JD844_023070 [Phrynosoma platyrhinos]|uniref:Uncharacterized protein n=1 Tax=Phrynosoma platyrhinos TaxID=52577 RepID=A0ABQ7SVY9_PHRPL|nr:hypothetical protein JD844_023070 [Phrynosoma platyrhinos]
MHLCGKDALRFTLEGAATFKKLGSEYLILHILGTPACSLALSSLHWFCMVYSEVPNFSEPNADHLGQPTKAAQGEQSNNSLPSANVGTCTFGPAGNGLPTGPELSGVSTAYNHAPSYAGTGRTSGRGAPVPSVPSNNARPLQSTISNGRDPRRASKR